MQAIQRHALRFGIATAILASTTVAFAQSAPNCPTMRKINVGVSVAPPNVVHTSPYVAKELGFFAKRCIDANIVQFEGGQSQTSDGRRGSRQRHRQRQRRLDRPRPEGAADLGPRAAHAAGLHGAGGHHQRGRSQGQAVARHRRRRRRLQLAHGPRGSQIRQADVEADAQFIPSPTAGRLPGLIADQIDGVALHPEDVYLAKKQKPTLNALSSSSS